MGLARNGMRLNWTGILFSFFWWHSANVINHPDNGQEYASIRSGRRPRLGGSGDAVPAGPPQRRERAQPGIRPAVLSCGPGSGRVRESGCTLRTSTRTARMWALPPGAPNEGKKRLAVPRGCVVVSRGSCRRGEPLKRGRELSNGVHDIGSIIKQSEGQYFDRKSLWEQPPEGRKPRNRRAVRDQLAKYVAAFANADGGTLVLGVEDDGTPTGHGYPQDVVEEFLAVPQNRISAPQACGSVLSYGDHELIVFEVPAARRAVMVVGDGFPRRVGDEVVLMSEEEINAIKRRGEAETTELEPVPGAGLEELDARLLSKVRETAGLSGATPQEYLLVRRLADRRAGELVLTQGAILLFAGTPHIIPHPNSGVRIFRVTGTERLTGARHNVQEFPRIEGALPTVIQRTHELLSTLIRKSARLHDLFFRESPEYPTFAWQEAIVNAVAHRDYRRQGNCVEVWLYEDRLEIRSPGGLVPEVTLEALQRRARVHVSRNPRIARVLTELGVMREQGEGIPRMFEEMEESFLPLPEFEADDHSFAVTLRNQPIFDMGDPEWIQHLRSLPINNRQRRILAARKGAGFTNGEYQSINKVDRDTAYRDLREMVAAGLLAGPEGRGRGARYRVVVERLEKFDQTIDVEPLQALVLLMQKRGFVQSRDFQKAFAVGRYKAWSELTALVASGVLTRDGERRWTKYRPGPKWDEWLYDAQFST